MSLANALQSKHARFNSKSAPLLPPIGMSKIPTEEEVNLNKVVVITKNDLDRITGHLERRKREKETVVEDQNRRKEMHEKSLALTRTWNNTIEGSRRRKLEQRKLREDNEEEQKKQVDLEHEKFMAEERKKALDQAKLLQYYETDKIKTFHSALKLTEVLKEREAQIEMKKLLDKMNREREMDEETKNQLNYKEQANDDLKLTYKKQQERNQLNEYHKMQIKQKIDELKNGRLEKDKDKALLQQLTDQYNYEQEQLEQIQVARTRELKQVYDRTIENRQRMKEVEAMMDEEENEEIRVYAAAKKKMAKMRRDKEMEMWRQKQDERDKIISYLGALLKQQEDDQDFRIAKAVEKREMKLAQEEMDKMKNLREMQISIEKYRREAIKMRQLEKERQKQETEEYMRGRLEADHLFQVYEDEKHKKGMKDKATIAKNNLSKAKERKDNDRKQRISEIEYIKQEKKLADLEDKQFEDYANKVIDYMEKHGRNTYPLKRVFHGHLRENGENRENEMLSEAGLIKAHQNEIPTNKNLGFTH